MTALCVALSAFLDAGPTALLEVAEAKGSTPREKGAWMLVSPAAIFGTIGGGQLEFMAIDKARQMLAAAGAAPHRYRDAVPHPYSLPVKNGERGAPTSQNLLSPSLRGEGKGEARRDVERLTLDIPLGPEIGQCCGGRVEVAISLVDRSKRDELIAMAIAEEHEHPHIYIFGGGHVGHALAASLGLLPVRPVIVETRADARFGAATNLIDPVTPVLAEVLGLARLACAVGEDAPCAPIAAAVLELLLAIGAGATMVIAPPTVYESTTWSPFRYSPS